MIAVTVVAACRLHCRRRHQTGSEDLNGNRRTVTAVHPYTVRTQYTHYTLAILTFKFSPHL